MPPAAHVALEASEAVRVGAGRVLAARSWEPEGETGPVSVSVLAWSRWAVAGSARVVASVASAEFRAEAADWQPAADVPDCRVPPVLRPSRMKKREQREVDQGRQQDAEHGHRRAVHGHDGGQPDQIAIIVSRCPAGRWWRRPAARRPRFNVHGANAASEDAALPTRAPPPLNSRTDNSAATASCPARCT